MELLVKRERSTSTATPGTLSIDGKFFSYTLEDVVREIAGVPVAQWKIQHITAIPAGRYRVALTTSPKFSEQAFYKALAGGRVPEVYDVQGFQGIRIHVGNWAKDTDGCLLVGKQRLDAETIVASRAAYKDLVPLLLAAEQRGEEVWITYKNPS
jgi:hypothetical protein